MSDELERDCKDELLSKVFDWRDLGNPGKTSVKIAGVAVEDRTQLFPHTSLEPCLYAVHFGPNSVNNSVLQLKRFTLNRIL
jgi:hypothetical protein